jgi:hypothetical protein
MTQPLNLAAFQSAKPAPKAEPATEWQSLDINTLSPDLQSAYFTYRKALDLANQHRKAFEAAMSDKVELPSHLMLAFGYKFGKLSIAIVKAERPTSAKPALSLADLIARADRK